MPGVMIDDAGERFALRTQPASARGPGSAAQVEHDRAVFDQQVVVAGPAINDAGRRPARWRMPTMHRRRRPGRAGLPATDRLERGDLASCFASARGLGWRKRAEADLVAGRNWPIFHSSACDDGGRADEAAEARAVGAEDHRHVAGEIDGADGVGVVVDVGRMQSGFAAVAARPVGFGPIRRMPVRVGIVVNLPVSREEACRCRRR